MNSSNSNQLSSEQLKNYIIKPLKSKSLSETKFEPEYEISQDSAVEKPISFEHYICILCENIVKNAKMCAECETLYCAKCLSKSLQFDSRCANCRKAFTETSVPRIVRNTLSEIKVFCPLLCRESVKLSEINNHIEFDCGNVSRIAQCVNCSREFEFKKNDFLAALQLQKHFDLCAERKVKCEFCEKVCLNKDLEKHMLDCGQRPIECPDCLIMLKDVGNFPHDTFVCFQIQQLRKLIKESGNQKEKKNFENIELEDFKRNNENDEKKVLSFEKDNGINGDNSFGIKSGNNESDFNINDVNDSSHFIVNKLFNFKDKLVNSINSRIGGLGNEQKSVAATIGDFSNEIIRNSANSIQAKVFGLFSNYIYDINGVNNQNSNNANNSSESQNNLPLNTPNNNINNHNNKNNPNSNLNNLNNNNNNNNNNINNNANNIPTEKNDHKSNTNNIKEIKIIKNPIITEIKPFNPSDIKQTYSTTTLHKSEVNSIIFIKSTQNSTENYNIVTSGGDSSIKIWDSNACLIESINVRDTQINALLNFKSANKNFIDFQNLLICGGSAKDLKIFDFPKRKFLFNLHAHTEAVNCLEQIKCKKNEFLVASGGLDAKLIIWDLYSRSVLFVLTQHFDSVNALKRVDWEKNDFTLASASSDKTVRIWNVFEGKLLTTLIGHLKSVNDICAFSVFKSALNLEVDEGKTRCENENSDENNKYGNYFVNDFNNSKKNTCNFNDDKSNNYNYNYKEQGRNTKRNKLDLIASCSWDHTIRLWDCEAGLQLKVFKAHNISVSSINFIQVSEEKVFLVSAGFDKTIKFWDLACEYPVAIIYGHLEKIKKINKLWLAEENKVLLVSGGFGDENGSLKIWQN